MTEETIKIEEAAPKTSRSVSLVGGEKEGKKETLLTTWKEGNSRLKGRPRKKSIRRRPFPVLIPRRSNLTRSWHSWLTGEAPRQQVGYQLRCHPVEYTRFCSGWREGRGTNYAPREKRKKGNRIRKDEVGKRLRLCYLRLQQHSRDKQQERKCQWYKNFWPLHRIEGRNEQTFVGAQKKNKKGFVTLAEERASLYFPFFFACQFSKMRRGRKENHFSVHTQKKRETQKRKKNFSSLFSFVCSFREAAKLKEKPANQLRCAQLASNYDALLAMTDSQQNFFLLSSSTSFPFVLLIET